jgi:hypothetical protein
VDNYTTIIDTSQFTGDMEDGLLKSKAIIIRMNGVWPQAEHQAEFYIDHCFRKQWNKSLSSNPVPYFIFSPYHTGVENYNFLNTYSLTGIKTIFVDVELENPGIDKKEYGKRLNDFYNLAAKKTHIVIYTGAWFTPKVEPWPDCEYWFSWWPEIMYPPAETKLTWDELDKKLKTLSWAEMTKRAAGAGIKTVCLWQCSGERLVVPGSPTRMDINVYPDSFDKYKAWVNNEQPKRKQLEGEKMNTLPVPYISQIAPGALKHNNDCGPTSSMMTLNAYKLALGVTVDDFYDSLQPSGDAAISVAQLQTGMLNYGLKNEWKVDLTPNLIYSYLSVGRPMIALTHYAPLVDAHLTQKTNFRGAHFVVLTGIDVKGVSMKDPYRDDGVMDVEVPLAVWMQAWKEANLDGNPQYGAIIPLLPIQDLSNVPPTPTAKPCTLAVGINGINVRSQPTSASTLVRTIWRSGANTPVFYVDGVSGEWSHLRDGGGYVFTQYIRVLPA